MTAKVYTTKVKYILPKVLPMLFWFLYLIHFAYVWYIQVDIPYWDEWYLLMNGHNLNDLSLADFIFTPLLESRISLTYFQVWLFEKLFHWNLSYQGISNFLVFGGILLMMIKILKAHTNTPTSFIYLVMLPLLTPLSWEAHGWAQQSHTHYSVFFAILLSYYSFIKKDSLKNYVIISCIYPLLIFTWGRGFASGIGIFFCYFLSSITLFFHRKPGKEYLLGNSLVIISFVLSCLFYTGSIILDPLNVNKSGLALLLNLDFYKYFLYVSSFIFGWTSKSIALGLISILFTLYPILLTLKKRNFNLSKIDSFEWFCASLIITWILSTGAIAFARTGVVPLGTAKSSRYAFATIFVFPIISVYYYYHIQTLSNMLTKYLGYSLILFSSLGFFSSLKSSNYEDFYYKRKMAGAACISHYIHTLEAHTKPLKCPTVSPHPDLRQAIDSAKKLNLSFIKKIENHKRLNTRFRRVVESK